MMKHLKGTMNLKLKLRADSLNITKWHVDASHAVHPDMKSHTGGSMTLDVDAFATLAGNRNQTPKAPQNWNLQEQTMSCHKFCGQDTFFTLKVATAMKQQFVKPTRLLSH